MPCDSNRVHSDVGTRAHNELAIFTDQDLANSSSNQLLSQYIAILGTGGILERHRIMNITEKCFIGYKNIGLHKKFKFNDQNYSVLSKHMYLNNHNFHWKNAKILDQECKYHSRMMSEM